MDRLEIYLFGETRIIWNGIQVTDRLSSKAVSIICLLAFNAEKSFGREKLIDYFWRNSSNDAAKYNLRYVLWTIRKIIKMEDHDDESAIINVKDKCRINPAIHVVTDINDADELIERMKIDNSSEYLENLEKVSGILEHEFMEGFFLKGCHEFNDWIFSMREKYQRIYMDVMERMVIVYNNKRYFDRSIQVLKLMLKINPFQEEFHIKIMEAYFNAGKRKEAIRQYDKCCEILRDELNVSPVPETKEMYKKILNHHEDEGRDSLSSVETKNRNNISIVYSNTLESERVNDLTLDGCKINTRCYPAKGIDYYWLYELMEGIATNSDLIDIKDIPHSVIDNLRLIGIDIAMEVTTSKENVASAEGGKLRIFLSMYYLLRKINQKIVILIEDFQCMDDTSYEFFKYIAMKCIEMDMVVVLYGDKSDSRFIELNKIMDIEIIDDSREKT